MRVIGLLIICCAVLACSSYAAAGTAPAIGPSPDQILVSTADPFFGMAEISTAATQVVECPTGGNNPKCAHGPEGEDCSAPEDLIFCHCEISPIRICVKNP